MAINSNEKGKEAERAVVRWLQAAGYTEARRTKAGQRKDPGDVEPLGELYPPPLIISVKNGYTKDPHLGTGQWWEWWDDLQDTVLRRSPNSGLGLLCHKREGKASPSDWRWWVATGGLIVTNRSCKTIKLPPCGPIQLTGAQALWVMNKWAPP